MPLSFGSSFAGLSFSGGSSCIAASKYVVPGLLDTNNQPSDFGADYAIMLLLYLYENWCIETPTELKKPTALPSDIDDPTDPGYVPNSLMRFRYGFPDDFKPYQVLTLQGDTPEGKMKEEGGGIRRRTTEVWITLKAKNLGRDGVDNENDQFTFLGIMERNVERIVDQYKRFNIAGIEKMDFRGGGRIYTVKDSWANSVWGSRWKVDMTYWKQDLNG